MKSIKEIEEQIDQVAAELHLLPINSDKIPDVIDSAVQNAGYKGIGAKWRRLEESPVQYISYHIGHDLAYNHEQLVDPEKCQDLATALVEFADENAVWFTNHSTTLDHLYEKGVSAWIPVTDWTFDAIYIAIGERTALIVCFKAED